MPTTISTWGTIAQQLATTTDKLGRPIDPGIFDAVVALNALGFKTVQSCEGHLDHGIAAPWIDIEIPQANELRQEITTHQRAAYPQGGTNPLCKEAKQASEQLKREQGQVNRRFLRYLEQFYAQHSCPYPDQIILHPWGRTGRVRLESIGAEHQVFEDDEAQRARNLANFKDEMRSLVEFLKKQYIR